MPSMSKLNAVVVMIFALLFYAAFMFMKHATGLSDIIPFGDDPYDAVGSYGVIVAPILAVVSLVRAFRGYPAGGASAAQGGYLVRTQTAVALCALITVLADAVAMARDPSRWLGAPARAELLATLAGLTLAALGVQILLCRAHGVPPARRLREWARPGLLLLVVALVLGVYPPALVRLTLAHLVTCVVSGLMLFGPMPPLIAALVPMTPDEMAGDLPAGSRPRLGGKLKWGIVTLIGIAVGVFAFAGEMSEGGGTPASVRIAMVAAVFIGLATAGLLVAYAFLARPLGLARRA